MKRIVSLGILTLFLCSIGFSQSDEFVLTWPIVVAETKKSDAEIENPKKAANLKTWTERGRKYLELFTFDLKAAHPGMPIDQSLLYMKGTPKSQRTEGGYTIYSYDRIDLYFKNNALAKYERTGSDAGQYFGERTKPLKIAKESYIKAKELDSDGKRSILIGEQLKKIIDLYTSEGLYFYTANDYKNAAVYFSEVGNIIALKYDNLHDSVRASTLIDCGTVARMGQNYDDAIKFYTLALQMMPQPKVALYYDIVVCHKERKDTTAAINALLEVIAKYPNDENIVGYTTELINFYIKLNQFDKALEYLTKALEKEPNNTNFIFNIAFLYETAGKFDLAVENYKKALQINPKDEGSNLNLGIMYRNRAKKRLDEAEAAYGSKNYTTIFNDGKSLLKLSYPYLETYVKVLEEKTNSNILDEDAKRNAYKDLASIYAQLGMNDQYNANKKKYDSYVEVSKSNVKSKYGEPENIVQIISGNAVYETWYYKQNTLILGFKNNVMFYKQEKTK